MNLEVHKPQQKVVLYPRNMICSCCFVVIRQLLEKEGAKILNIKPGEVEIMFNPLEHNREYYTELLSAHGFEPIFSRERQIVEKIKLAVIELIHKAGNVNSMIRNSDYLVERLGLSYAYLTNLFSRHEHITLEKFIILHKIEKVKELIEYDEYTLSEIAVQLGYSSVQYLSAQFRQVTGISVTEYKKGGYSRMPVDLIGDQSLTEQPGKEQ
ncbi:AraC family transcriptional regulator [Lentimicrobium sp.]|jgi:AraC-like DNA-binding protein|uniref:helix-turn-helix domain-containing protein n=1 Tax=Lentimicrobium sp. TaxID=2034841 RepID=UPI002C3B7596|nr:AraC family transcriptional regulator [Lentimicrobium sp.]HPF64000.1 AraC family transcriptional regulator [Lentimicrobium sp.]HRW68415.1 AraC family transcriptional regulator [Lentimicrobium sp.]